MSLDAGCQCYRASGLPVRESKPDNLKNPRTTRLVRRHVHIYSAHGDFLDTMQRLDDKP